MRYGAHSEIHCQVKNVGKCRIMYYHFVSENCVCACALAYAENSLEGPTRNHDWWPLCGWRPEVMGQGIEANLFLVHILLCPLNLVLCHKLP